jgi:hypothetical protein
MKHNCDSCNYSNDRLENYLKHNDLNVMSEWDYLVRLHIR